MSSNTIDTPLTSYAIFVILSINKTPENFRLVCNTLKRINPLMKSVAFRDPNAAFICTIAIGSDAWDSLTNLPRPSELRLFQEIKGAKHTAVSTPGDILLHIRAERHDMCFEFERQILDILGDAVTVVDETIGFRYFDLRDLLGFVDGTANPIGQAVPNASIIAESDDAAAVGGSYVVVQKYLHDLTGWNQTSIEKQEAIVGRTKLDNMQLPDAPPGRQGSHKRLTSGIVDEFGQGHEILRDNMPFGSPGSKDFGTYFIGYSKKLWVVEKMLERMFVGDPVGLHDQLLDFSRAVTGSVFFVPSAQMLARFHAE